jgi:predicted PurR-regulated permease PerM
MPLKLNEKVIYVVLVIIGLVVPFIPLLDVIETFFLLIPFAVIFIVTLIYLTVSLINKNINRRKAVIVFSLLPTFIFSQFLSVFIVHNIQKFRCQQIISEVEEHKTKTGEFPEEIKIPLGIEYILMKDKKSFQISYSRGFMVTERYYSNDKDWTSYGWND